MPKNKNPAPIHKLQIIKTAMNSDRPDHRHKNTGI